MEFSTRKLKYEPARFIMKLLYVVKGKPGEYVATFLMASQLRSATVNHYLVFLNSIMVAHVEFLWGYVKQKMYFLGIYGPTILRKSQKIL